MAVLSLVRGGIFAAVLLALGGCAAVKAPPHLKPLPAELRATLAKKGMKDEAPIFVRIFKEESQLEVWKAKDNGRYDLVKAYPICRWSGALGPKIEQGDKQAPEGFYNVVAGNMNPHSKYHLAFNLGYPNVYDRSHGRTGKHLMVHGNCKSAGCYAMTDALIEEIYLLARDAFIGGQDHIPVHAFPFRMTKANMSRHRKDKWYRFWRDLKAGYDYFETYKMVPTVKVCSKRYLVNVAFVNPNQDVDPAARCPAYRKLAPGEMPASHRQIMANRSPRPSQPVATASEPPQQAAFVPASAAAAEAPSAPAPTTTAVPTAARATDYPSPQLSSPAPASDPFALKLPAERAAALSQKPAVPPQNNQPAAPAGNGNAALFSDNIGVATQQRAPEIERANQEQFNRMISDMLRQEQGGN